MTQMRILMCAGFYDIGGFSTVMEKLAEKLSEKGHEVTIGALMFKRFPSKGAYSVVRLPVDNILKLNRFLEKFDIIHNHHPLTNFLSLLNNKTFIYHYHGAPDLGRGYLYRSNMLASIKITSHKFDAVITVSEAGREEFEQLFSLENVYVIYNGVDTNLFKLGLEERFRKGTPQFLFVGNLYVHKMVEELILAFEKLIKEYPSAHLEIVGRGSAYGKLEKLITKLNLCDHVTLVGRVSKFDLPHHYASCDVYVTASRYEVCPVPLLEAMASGKPIVASSIPPHVDLLTKSKAGTIYAQGNIAALCESMVKTYENTKIYRDNAVHFAKEHDWSSIAMRILNVYNQVLRPS